MKLINVCKRGYDSLELKDGSVASSTHAAALLIILEHKLLNNQLMFLDIVMTARGVKPTLFPNHIPHCYRDLRICDPDGRIRGVTRRIIINSVEGEGTDLRLTTPWKEDTE